MEFRTLLRRNGGNTMKTKMFSAVGLLAMTLALGSCGSSSPSAQSLLSSTTSAVEGAQSVRFSDVTRVGNSAETLSGVTSATNAQEVSLLGSTIQLEVKLVGTTIYLLSPSSSILVSALGISAAVATGITNQWISITATDSPYAAIIASLSVSSILSVYYPKPSAAHLMPSKTISGVSVTPISATIGNGVSNFQETTLFVSTKTSLPVAASIAVKTSSTTQSKQAVFKDWNAPVSVSAPQTSITFSSISS